MLENTKERDMDQVVSRWCQRVKSEARHNILMVDQLWLWTTNFKPPGSNINTNTTSSHAEAKQKHEHQSLASAAHDCFVITCFPSRTGTDRSMDDLRRLVLDPSHRRREPIRSRNQLISRILESCSSVFDRLQITDMLRFFQMFEDSIGSIVSLMGFAS